MTVILITLAGCATRRPVLYPNEHLTRVGVEAAEQDIRACMDLASHYGLSASAAGRVAGETATDATVGAASGGAVGSIYGNAGDGAAAGAVGSTVSGLVRKILRPRPPDPAFQRYVDQCLREGGYEPVSWQ
jgi:hypothetical protein